MINGYNDIFKPEHDLIHVDDAPEEAD